VSGERGAMTDEELSDELFRAYVTHNGGPTASFLVVARCARALLAATPLPPEPAPGFVRVRVPVQKDIDGRFYIQAGIMRNGRVCPYYTAAPVAFITADVPLPAAPAEVEGSVET
jgi:hypothetical protein